jgi:predicted HTH transcriptional regulator
MNFQEKMMGGGSCGCENSGGNEFNPMEMCQKMMSAINQSSELATFTTPEIRGLFEEWAQQIDAEILNFIKENPSTTPGNIANHLKISENSAIYIVSRLAQKGKVSLKIEKG